MNTENKSEISDIISWDCKIILANNIELDFKFDYDSLVSVARVGKDFRVVRDINWNEERERIYYIKIYDAVTNSISHKAKFSLDVYNGLEIKSRSFMTELLNNTIIPALNSMP